jgi:DNA invertase Pin-like site-specific DNA recombinase
LGRSKSDVKRLLTELKEKKVVVRILDLPTTMATYGGDSGQAIMELINDIIIEVIAYMAEAERMNIRKRQEEGIASAKARGVHFGREKYDFPESWKEDYDDWVNGRCTARSLMKKYHWSSTTFYRKVREYKK